MAEVCALLSALISYCSVNVCITIILYGLLSENLQCILHLGGDGTKSHVQWVYGSKHDQNYYEREVSYT